MARPEPERHNRSEQRPLMMLDVTRLIWRRWRGGQPTGVDRVCLAYLEYFGPRAQAVVQRKGMYLTFSAASSRKLFAILLSGASNFRRRMVRFAANAALPFAVRKPPAGALYLNVGHTGLDEPSLPVWIARNQLRAIYLIHDLIPITHPQFCRPGEDRRHERRMRNVLESASGVIANSQDTENELAALAARLSLPMPDTIVAWLSGDALPRRPKVLPSTPPYYVVLGTIEGRKNHRLLLDVWRRLVEKRGNGAPRLVIVGMRGWQADEVFHQLDALGLLKGKIEELGRCSDERLADLLAGARALLMPSFAEGYGLPVFEALELGTPVIAADLPVYCEVAGAIPQYLPPSDVAAWEAAIVDYLSDEGPRAEQLKRMKDFTVPDWQSHFALVERWLGKHG